MAGLVAVASAGLSAALRAPGAGSLVVDWGSASAAGSAPVDFVGLGADGKRSVGVGPGRRAVGNGPPVFGAAGLPAGRELSGAGFGAAGAPFLATPGSRFGSLGPAASGGCDGPDSADRPDGCPGGCPDGAGPAHGGEPAGGPDCPGEPGWPDHPGAAGPEDVVPLADSAGESSCARSAAADRAASSAADGFTGSVAEVGGDGGVGGTNGSGYGTGGRGGLGGGAGRRLCSRLCSRRSNSSTTRSRKSSTCSSW